MAKKQVEKKEEKGQALLVIPLFLGAGVLAYLFTRKPKPVPGTAVLYGKVTDVTNGNGIAGITVSCNSYTAQTNSFGDYQIANIEPGDYLVSFTDPQARYDPGEVPLQLVANESRQLNVALAPVHIEVQIAANCGVRMADSGQGWESAWLRAWGAAVSDDNEFDTDPARCIFPAAWWDPYPPVGVRRHIMFFNTTGIEGPLTLHLFNSAAYPPGYYGPADETLCILSGNGASPNLNKAIYGWIRSRFLPQYLIATQPISYIPSQQWGTFDIPAEFVNSQGYTAFICVLGSDYNCVSNGVGDSGSYLLGSKSYITTK
jgi:hypothetical protein